MFKKKHECDYFVVAVDHDTVAFKNDQNQVFSRKQSYVLWKCSCGDIIQDTINGHFKLCDLQLPWLAEAKGEGK